MEMSPILDANDEYVISAWHFLADDAGLDLSQVDAERIVACVNACRHLPTEFLNGLPNGFDAVGLVQAQQYVPRRKIEIQGATP